MCEDEAGFHYNNPSAFAMKATENARKRIMAGKVVVAYTRYRLSATYELVYFNMSISLHSVGNG